jgi:hypothetical protein
MNPSVLTRKSLDSQPSPDRRGWLRHGNRPGDYAKAPRCGARTRAGGCCRQPAMRNGRCRMHGGLSTGPRTAAGLERSRRARWKHGFCSAEIREQRSAAARVGRNLVFLTRLARELCRQQTQSSLGMGSIERNEVSVGRSGGNARVGATGGRPDAAPQCRKGDRRSPLQDSATSASPRRHSFAGRCVPAHTASLGMGSIERNRPAAGRSSGTPLDCRSEPRGAMLRPDP